MCSNNALDAFLMFDGGLELLYRPEGFKPVWPNEMQLNIDFELFTIENNSESMLGGNFIHVFIPKMCWF